MSRRSILKKAAVGGAIVWTAPVVTTVMSPVSASTGSICSPSRISRWRSFSFGGAGTVGTTFTRNFGGNGGIVDVTDAYLTGDIFSVQIDGVTCGSTTTVPNLGNSVWTNNPAVAYADARWSSGRFYVAPGVHTITIVVTASPWGSGGAFYRFGRC